MLASKKRHYELIRVTIALFFMLENIRESTAEGNAEEFIAAGLVEHNLLRARHLETGPLEIDSDLNEKAAKCAQHYLQKNVIDHSCTEKGDAGENLYIASSSGHSTPGDAVKAVKDGTLAWYDEIKDYDYTKNSAKNQGDVVGHFTQLVWKGTEKLGVGHASQMKDKFETTVVVCLYSPAGNIFFAGDQPLKYYEENVLKLKDGIKELPSLRSLNGTKTTSGTDTLKPGKNVKEQLLFTTVLTTVLIAGINFLSTS